MNILVTGATGFVGRNLIAELRKCNTVFAVVRNPQDLECLGLQGFVINGDVQKLKKYIESNGIDGVIHLAAMCVVHHDSSQIGELISSNITFGTMILEAACSVATVKWFINTGSIWQNFNSIGNVYNPVNLYAATKEAFIDIAKYYTEVSKIKFCTLKLCDCYGPEDRRGKILSLLKDSINSEKILYLTPGEQKIDILYITDVVKGFIHLIHMISSDLEIKSEYVLSAGYFLTLREIVSIFEKKVGKSLNVKWGGKQYRFREVMSPWIGEQLPGWHPDISISEGISMFLKAKD